MSVQYLSCVQLFAVPWDCSLPGSSVHGLPGKNTGGGHYNLLQGIFTTQGANPHLLRLLYWQVDSLSLCHLGKPAQMYAVLNGNHKTH